jgi:branched-chain amino acid transport system permease protein
MSAAGWRRERIDRPIKVQTDDLYALASVRNLAYLLLPRLLPPLALLAFALSVPNPYYQRVVTIAGVFALLALSFGFLYQSVGLVSLGGALFFGCGAYVAGALNRYYGLPILATVPAGTLLGAGIATGLLLPSLRLRGIYFALVSLALPLLLQRIIEATHILGGTEGLYGLDFYPTRSVEVLVVLGTTTAAFFLFRRLLSTDLGLVLRAIRDNDQAVRASGIDIIRYKALAVFLAALPGAFAGAYSTHLIGFVGLDAWSLDYSVLPIAASVVGGLGTLAGPIVGAFVLVPLSEQLRDQGSLRVAVYSILLVAFILVWREGIVSYLVRMYHQLERWVRV